MKNSIETYISQLEDFSDIAKVTKMLEHRRDDIINHIWEERYKEMCAESYIPFNEIISSILFWNSLDTDHCTQFEKYVKSFSSRNNITLNSILNYANKCELELPDDFTAMLCKVCACKDCHSLKSHLGYTCDECRNEMHYTGYRIS